MYRKCNFLALILALSAMAAAQDAVTGVWTATGVSFAPWTFTLRAEGGRVTGTVSQGGSSGSMTTNPTGATPIYDGAIEGNEISFKCDSPGARRNWKTPDPGVSRGRGRCRLATQILVLTNLQNLDSPGVLVGLVPKRSIVLVEEIRW